MAHEIDFSNNRANIAYVGDTPWHGLGEVLPEGAPLEVWKIAAGMDWTIDRAPVQYRIDTPNGKAYIKAPERDVLYRSDTKIALGVVSDRYQAVQPGEVLEFFRDLVTAYDYSLEVAGCLFGGKRFWALARTGDEDYVTDGRDRIKKYMLLATSADGSLATQAMDTTVRVVCNNTLRASIGQDGAGAVKISHRQKFDANAVKKQLGISRQTFAEFMDTMRALSGVKVNRIVAAQAACALFPTTKKDPKTGAVIDPVSTFPVQSVLSLFDGKARGSQFAGVQGTAYGFVQAVTEFVDHEARAHSGDNRLNSAWFGRGADLKAESVRLITELAA